MDLKPTAECDECGWRSCGFWTPRDITNRAKKHARQHPGHKVFVERISHTMYVCDPDGDSRDDDD